MLDVVDTPYSIMQYYANVVGIMLDVVDTHFD